MLRATLASDALHRVSPMFDISIGMNRNNTGIEIVRFDPGRSRSS
jgi:hypothetical protein